MDKILSEATDLCHKPLGVKLPPYIDSVQIERVAKVLLAHPIAFINCINNLPLCLWVNVPEETASIKPNNGIGGLGGTYIKPLALGNISKFYKLTQGKIDIIGTGGVESGQDAFEMLLAGAKAVQVGTAFMKIGTSVFTKITQELTTLIQNKGYHTIQQFNGKLRLL
jgi:dihydroorotate dehydrogenase (fumarate)